MAHGQSESVVNQWRTALIGLVVVVGFAFVAPRVSAFTEPTEAPPGGNAISAPVNVSTTEQTKPGRLNLTGIYQTGLVPALAVGTAAVPKQICWNDDCKGGWADVRGGATALLRTGTTPAVLERIPFGQYDQGFLSVGTSDNTQIWAIGGQASNPVTATTAGVYGSSFEGYTSDPYSTTARSYGVLGVAHFAFQTGGAAGGIFTAGVVGISKTEYGPAGYFENRTSGPAAMFRGNVGIWFANPANIGASFSVNRIATAAEPTTNIADTISAYSDRPGSAVYAEQRNFNNPAAYAGYFSGRVAVIDRVDPSTPTDGHDSVLAVRCLADGSRCFDVDLEKTGGFVWQTFRHAGDERWWIRSDTGGSSPFFFGIDSRPGSGGSETTTGALRISEPGDVAVAGGYAPTVSGASSPYTSASARLVVHRGSVTGSDLDGGTSDAIAAFANGTTGAALYAQQQGVGGWAGYFSGDVGIGASGESRQLCLNGSCVTSLSGGPGTSQWTLNAGTNTIFPSSSSRRVAIGGSTDTAPFYYDPGANVFSLLDRGYLALRGGALYLKEPPSGGDQPPPDLGAAGDVKPGERLADLLKPRAALAGSVTNPGGPPPVRLFVRDGVVSIEASGSKLELGNAGRDIASTGSIFIRPNGVIGAAMAEFRQEISQTSLYAGRGHFDLTDATNTVSTVYARNANTAGGWAGYFVGRVNIVSGSLCFTPGSCRSSWPTLGDLGGVGGTGTANTVAKFTAPSTLGNSQTFDNGTVVRIGGTAASGARFIVNQAGTVTGGSSGDAIAAVANSTFSAIYAQQDDLGGWASVVSGGTKIYGGLAPLGPGAPAGHKLVLGGSSNSTGLEFKFYEAENMPTDPPPPNSGINCAFLPNRADSTASGGFHVRIDRCEGTPDPVKYGGIAGVTLNRGTYDVTIRMRTTDLSFGNNFRFGFDDLNVTRREIFTASDVKVGRQWEIYSYRFNIAADNTTIHPAFDVFLQAGAGEHWLDVDWIMIQAATQERPRLRMGTTALTAVGVAWTQVYGFVGSRSPGSQYLAGPSGPAQSIGQCIVSVAQVTPNFSSGFGCRYNTDPTSANVGLIEAFVNPGGSIRCSFICSSDSQEVL